MQNKSLQKRYQESYDSKNSASNTKKSVMDWSKVEATFFTPQIGRNRINIIPYQIKSKNHPLVIKGSLNVGDLDYVMDLFVHRNVGASESSVICLKKNYGKNCPICEMQDKFRKEGKEKEANEFKASRRVFYNVQDLQEPHRLKIFETSHFLFEKELIDESMDDDGGFVDFADVENGKEIRFRANEVQKGSIKYKEFKSFSFNERQEAISDDIVNQAISFDDILSIPTYEEVKKILQGEDDYDVDDEKSIYDEIPDPFAADDNEKGVESLNDDSCPAGHNFGVDVDNYDDCDNCKCWEQCFSSNKLKK